MILNDDFLDSKIEEVTDILESYDVFEHDIDTITEIIEHIGKLWIDACKTGRQLEMFVKDELGQTGYEKFMRIITYREEPGKHLATEL